MKADSKKARKREIFYFQLWLMLQPFQGHVLQGFKKN